MSFFLNNMDRRRTPRVTALLSVRVWGVDTHSLPFTQDASVKNISGGGAVIHGMQRQVRPGEILEVQYAGEKAQFRVVWAGKLGTRREGQIGIQSVGSEPSIWDVSLERCGQFAGKG